jgi:hypothetical protein
MAVAIVLGAWSGCRAADVRNPCAESLTQAIPARPAAAPGGHAFADQVRGLSEDERESRIVEELRSGNIPRFLRRLIPIQLHDPTPGNGATEFTVCSMPDYLAIGSDDDYLLIPMRLKTALSAATEFSLTLPTPRIVDAIYAQAAQMRPQPLPAGPAMRSTEYSIQHNELIKAQRGDLGISLGALVAGDKKDLVLTNRLWSHQDRVAIYGWHTAPGRPIQSLSTVHGWRYADYSHGVRLISTQMFINGQPHSLFAALQNAELARALSGEGVITNLESLVGTLAAHTESMMTAALRRIDGLAP